MNGRAGRAVVLGAVSVVALAARAEALINPNFTPVQLVRQADLILSLRFKPTQTNGVLAAAVQRVVKGKAPATVLRLDLNASVRKEHARTVGETLKRIGGGPALLFVGTGETGEHVDLLHLDGTWVRLDAKPGKPWRVEAIDSHMEGTWAGHTTMLLRAVDYILQHPGEPDVPVDETYEWAERRTIGRIDDAVHDAQPVVLDADGRISLFIAAEKGDRLFRYDVGLRKFQDVTARRRLTSRSHAAVWADFDADGRLDLASFDGAALRLWRQAADGTFPATGRRIPVDLRAGCLGLSALDVGPAGRPGLLLSTRGAPVLLRPTNDGAFEAGPLPKAAFKTDALGPAARCLVADLDGDSLFDVLHLFARGSLVYKGKGAGRFAAPGRCDVALGQGRGCAVLGDYDADGYLDIFTSAEDRCRLWHNRGGLRFTENLAYSGESADAAERGGIAGLTCDVNNDGRQDLLIVNARRQAQVFFNRGFLSFGKALKLAREDVIEETAAGQQAGTMADLNGDGAQDMALVLTDGSVRVFLREVFEDEPALGVRVALPPGGAFAGPLTVTASIDERQLGAWNIVAGSREALFGRVEAGEVTLTWRFPGARERKQVVLLEQQSIWLLLRPQK